MVILNTTSKYQTVSPSLFVPLGNVCSSISRVYAAFFPGGFPILAEGRFLVHCLQESNSVVSKGRVCIEKPPPGIEPRTVRLRSARSASWAMEAGGCLNYDSHRYMTVRLLLCLLRKYVCNHCNAIVCSSCSVGKFGSGNRMCLNCNHEAGNHTFCSPLCFIYTLEQAVRDLLAWIFLRILAFLKCRILF